MQSSVKRLQKERCPKMSILSDTIINVKGFKRKIGCLLRKRNSNINVVNEIMSEAKKEVDKILG